MRKSFELLSNTLKIQNFLTSNGFHALNKPQIFRRKFKNLCVPTAFPNCTGRKSIETAQSANQLRNILEFVNFNNDKKLMLATY